VVDESSDVEGARILEGKTKSFHFQEMNWLISFPDSGNEGRKYLYYSVVFKDRKKGNAKSQVSLMDIVDGAEFEKNYPHTVGFFRGPIDNDADFNSNYLEIRVIRCIEEFWKFLNDLNL
jgi:hypothetical protein